MPAVDNTGKYSVESKKAGISDGITFPTQESQTVNRSAAKAKKSLSERSAFSENDLKGRLAASEQGNAIKDGIVSRHSESNIHLAKLDVPFFDDSRSEASGGSGLAIVPSLDGRSLLSQDSGREILPIVSTVGGINEHSFDQEEKGSHTLRLMSANRIQKLIVIIIMIIMIIIISTLRASTTSAPSPEKIDFMMWLSVVFNNKEGKILFSSRHRSFPS